MWKKHIACALLYGFAIAQFACISWKRTNGNNKALLKQHKLTSQHEPLPHSTYDCCPLQAMGIDYRCLGMADTKKASQKWIQARWGSQIHHLFVDNQAYISAGGGKCLLHGGKCSPDRVSPDVLVAGLPCRPFTTSRQKSGKTSKTGCATHHPEYNIVMQQFIECLKARNPGGFIVEEVVAFAANVPRLNTSPLKLFAKDCATLGYSVRAMELDHSSFLESTPRKRLFIIGFAKKMGHSVASSWLCSFVESCMRDKAMCPAAKVFNVLDVNSQQEQARCEGGKECFLNLKDGVQGAGAFVIVVSVGGQPAPSPPEQVNSISNQPQSIRGNSLQFV